MINATAEDLSASNLFGYQRGLLPKFYYEREPKMKRLESGDRVQDTEKDGTPAYVNVECIEIVTVGGNSQIVRRRVQEKDRTERFPKAYRLWKEGQSYAVEGTPIEELPAIQQSQVQLLHLYNVTAIEQLAALDDAKISSLGMGTRELVTRAKKWLSDKEGSKSDILDAVRLNNLEAELAALRKQREADQSDLKAAKMALQAIRGSDDDEEDDEAAPKTRGKRGGRRKGAKAGGVEARSPNAVAEEDFTPNAAAQDSDDNPFADGDGVWDPAQEILKQAS